MTKLFPYLAIIVGGISLVFGSQEPSILRAILSVLLLVVIVVNLAFYFDVLIHFFDILFHA